MRQWLLPANPSREPVLGSAKDYVKNTPDFPNAYEIPLLGVQVNNKADSLKGGRAVSGVEVLSTIPGGPGARLACKAAARGFRRL